MVLISSLLIFTKAFADVIAFSNGSFEIIIASFANSIPFSYSFITTFIHTISQILLKIFQEIYLKELTIFQQMKQHWLSLKIYTKLHCPRVELSIRSHFNKRKIYPQ